MTRRILVVGASLAGLRTVQALRRSDATSDITLLGDEPHLPYNRPPLSKEFALGTVEEAKLRLADETALSRLEVDLRLGTTAQALDLAGRAVTVGTGERLGYDQLVMATGSSPRRLPGIDVLPGVCYLRTLDDARQIRSRLVTADRVVVVGGGFIGAELASAASSLSLDVTVVDPLPVLMERVLGARFGEAMARVHTDHGVRLELGRHVTAVAGETSVQTVVLDNGRTVPADLVVVAVGTVPNTAWFADSGLEVRDGVVCDEYLRAVRHPEVYAVGDVARYFNPRYGASMRGEHWTSAGEQAAAVARSLSGEPTAYSGLPYVWSDQFGTKLQVFGRVRPQDRVHMLLEEKGRLLAVTDDGHELQAVVALDAVREAAPWRKRLIDRGAWETSD